MAEMIDINRLAGMVNDLHTESVRPVKDIRIAQARKMLLTAECITASLQALIFRLEKGES